MYLKNLPSIKAFLDSTGQGQQTRRVLTSNSSGNLDWWSCKSTLRYSQMTMPIRLRKAFNRNMKYVLTLSVRNQIQTGQSPLLFITSFSFCKYIKYCFIRLSYKLRVFFAKGSRVYEIRQFLFSCKKITRVLT